MKKLLILIFLLIPVVVFGALSTVTMPAQNITKDSARFVGRVSESEAKEDEIVDLYGKFRYSKDPKNKIKTCQNMVDYDEVDSSSSLLGLDFFNNPFYNFIKDQGQLETGTDYYYCAIVSATPDFSSAVIYGNVMKFTPFLPPNQIDSVETLGSSNITDSSATISGLIKESSPDTRVYGHFRYSETPGLSCGALPNAKRTAIRRYNSGNVNLVVNLTGLKDGTTYYYCAVGATNSNMFNPVYGLVESFSTPISQGNLEKIGPVKTLPALQIDDDEATLRGSYTSGGPGFAYFRLSSSEIPPIFCNDIYGSDMIGITANVPDPIGYTTANGIFSVHVNGLEPETDYYYCAVVSNRAYNPEKARQVNDTQIKYGVVQKFRTLPCPTCRITTVTTRTAKVIDSRSVELRGSFKSAKEVEVYFEYSEVDNDPQNLQPASPVWKSTSVKKYGENSYGNYTQLLKNLKRNTTYIYRAVAKIAGPEIIYGDTIEFRTNKYDNLGGNLSDDDGSGGGGGYVSTGGGVIISTPDDNCPAGSTGTFPLCVPVGTDPLACPTGWKGFPPNCFNPGPGIPDPNGNDGTVSKQPKVQISANPVIIKKGESSVISWSSSATTSCTLNGYDMPTSGSANTGGLNNTTTYTISCIGPGGSAAASATVFVDLEADDTGGGDIVSVNVTATPIYITPGTSAIVSWTSWGAQFCDSGGHGNGTSGSFSTGPLYWGASYAVTCSGETGTAGDTAYVEIYIPPLPLPIPTCTDGIKNGDETDVDEGGHCGGGLDPDGNPWPTCTDGIKNGDEEGVDFGGHCGYGNIIPPLPTCTDGIKNGLETGVDTGGPCGDDNNTGGNGGGNTGGSGGNNPWGNPPGPGNPWSPGNPGGPGQNGNPPLPQTNDNDGDGINNTHDDDIDGDGDPNDTDIDIDGDGIPNFIDTTPYGLGDKNDFDGGGTPNNQDGDMDGDGIPNCIDDDTDGDGIPNPLDDDMDGDGIPNALDPTPKGLCVSAFSSGVLVLGQTATPPTDAIVRYHEGIETVFARQIRANLPFAERYGFGGGNIVAFAWNLAHNFSKNYFGYINKDNLEVRVSKSDVSAYELRQLSSTLVVYEYYENKIIDIRSKNTGFKQKNPYEYYFRRIFR